jgi:ssDNA-binding Zn-finger/Zn-ribbon topoisomerase 1
MEMLPIIKILIIVVIIVVNLFILKKVNPNFAINTKRVICPNCKTKQPIIRMPKNQRQILWGGTTCPTCETELDKFGNII